MDQNIYVTSGSNIHFSKLVFNKFKKLNQDNIFDKKHTENIPLENVSGSILNFPLVLKKIGDADIANNLLQKRKFKETEKDENEFKKIFSCDFPKISDSSHLKEYNSWEQYTSLKPFSLKSYSSLLSSINQKNNLSSDNLLFYKSTSAASPSNHIDQGEGNATHIDEIFTNAAGKSINVSNVAITAAQKLIENVFQNETYQIDCISVENKKLIKFPTLKKRKVFSCPITREIRNHKYDKITTGEIDSKNISNNHRLVNYNIDSVNFSTAAGKTVDVSEAAMKAAQNLIQDIFKNEDKIMPSTSSTYNTSGKNSTFKDIGCPPKKLSIENDDTMDEAFLEKFFQDAVTSDDKESQGSTESSKVKDIDKALVSKTNNFSPNCKRRKSLGGRRSMRFYPHT